MNKQFKFWPIIRDSLIIMLLTALGGFIVGFASTSEHNSPLYLYSLAFSNGIFGIVGFTISGCLAVGNRWRHLAIVAVTVWAASIFNVIFFGVTIILWLASVFAIVFLMLIGGGISYFLKSKNGEASLKDGDQFYDKVGRELREQTMVPGVWTKAYAEMGGDNAKARALYIKYRVGQLREANRQHIKDAWDANRQQLKREKQRAKIKAAQPAVRRCPHCGTLNYGEIIFCKQCSTNIHMPP